MIAYDSRGSRKKKKRMGYKDEAGRQDERGYDRRPQDLSLMPSRTLYGEKSLKPLLRKKSLEEIKAEFKLTDSQASYNLNMLESTLCIEKKEIEGITYYVLTPKGRRIRRKR